MKCLLTHYKALYLQALCLFFILCSSSLNAADCPAGFPPTTPQQNFSTSLFPGQFMPTAQLACDLAGDFFGTAVTYDGTNCVGTGVHLFVVVLSSCADQYVYNGTECVAQCTTPNNCPDAGTTGTNPLTTGNVTGMVTTASSLCIPQGGNDICGVSCDSGAASFSEITGESNVECYTYTFTGNACDGSETVAAQFDGTTQLGVTPENDPPQTADDCPPGTGFATINNTNSCLPGGTSITGGSSTTTNSDGSSTTTTRTTQINSDGTSTTTTETGFTDANGNTTTATTTGSGGLDTSGDDSQEPDFGAPPIFDQTLPIEADIDITVIDDDTPISTDLYGFTGSCPPPIVFTAMNQEFTISFQSVCDFAPIIRGIILMLASIAAIRILVS